MEILKRHRNLLRKRLTRSLKTTEEFLSGTPPIPVEDIEYNREIIEETHSELLVIQGKIRDFMLTSDVSEEELEQDDEEALQYTQRYKMIYKKCLALVEPRITASSPTTSEVSFASSSHHRTVKLPKIELKKFTGEIKDWLGWWAQFNKIHVDPTLEDSDKFQYLVQSMSPGTRASKMVNSYPLTAENYPKVIETLTERFGRPELLQQVYVRDLIRLMIDCSSKQQLKVTSFYDELVTHLRALESLKIEARQMSVFIFPMIEACLSEELMKAWQRRPLIDVNIDSNDSTQTRVDLIMKFLQKEAAAEQDRALAGSKFGLRSLKQDRNVGRQSHPAKIPTASGLFAGRAQNCIFCNKDHKNTECLAARRMSIKERRERIKNAKCCFSCLQPGHISSNCRRRITECNRCKKKHLDILCPLNAPGRESADEDKEQVEDCDVSPTVENGVSFSGLSASSLILLQTLKIKVEGTTSAKVVRALLDTGSQRSYILSKTAQDLGLSPIGQESLKHVVFGGHTSESVHQEYRVNLGHASGNFKMVAKLLDQQKICGSLPRLSRGPWLKELKARRIWVPDIGKDDMEIEILLGCDVLGSIFMMKSCVLSNGLTASQTRFGWTLMGECQPGSDVSLAHHVTTMTISESSVTNLWNLDVLGIMDPIEVKQRDQRDALARRHFLKTVQHSVSGRYVVSLPWTVEKAKIADNREVAMKRLEQTTKKLISLNLYEDYDDIFRGWLDDGIIEKVPAEQHDAEAFYLPHRPVVKLSSGTTPIRPVFDASSKVYRSPSLNDCLEKGPNLIEMIPNLMLRFRNGKFGVVADIKKAFLQIEVNERDRDYLRFLWYSQNREKTEVFRHRRVVFGVNCSPFILGAVIEYHLSNVRPEHKPLAQRLQKSFYVDNLVTSVNSFEELQDLKLTATSIMDNARLELSRWEHSLDVASDTYPFGRAEISKVLGICWDKREDCLSCEIPVAIPPKITKRSILSCLAQIYDPIGFLSPILIKPKILLQKAWTLKLAWDDELDRHYKDELSLWLDDLQLHKGMAIPRNFNPLMVPQKDWQIHTFVDASSEAYAAVVFLRTRVGDKVEVHMMAAKSRVAPLKRPTIPRLELLACVVGARLNKMIFEALELKDIKNVFWSDATTALAWIKRDDQWGTFVGNRVKEICRLSDPVNWRYVPSECNPADLPSRGCSLSRLIQSRWWEGPSWLKLSEEFWPSRYKDLNEEEICAERKKIAVVTTVKSTDHWYMKYFSSFIKNVRMMAWIRRFINNLRSSTKVKGELSVKEIDEAELALLKLVQAECFPSHSIPGLKVCEVEGILRVKTKLIYSSDEYGFRLPVLLHGTHPLIEKMICDSHVENCHAGVQFLMNKLRGKYWIVKARQTIKKIVRRCVTCRRFSAKPVVVEDAPLPATRVHNAKVFEVVGIDLAGPLYLKDQVKTWVVLFTCAVYRCVHLELVISLSTEDFLMALERFIKRRGRPSTIFSDNGTNFVGANNFFKKIDWERVSNDGKVKRIEWKFIPPTAAWWGGWWERLIRSLKDILKRMLGTSTLTYQQLMTLLCHAEAVMNGRPMTYVSDDPNDLVTISPSMFLQEQTDVEFPECQNMGSNPTTQKLRYLSKLREALKSRFRKEYLSLLVQRNRRIYNPKLQAGDVVLVGMDNKKRNFWPLAVIEEILFGRDGVNRLVKVKTAVGTFLRPIQKIYPLEISSTAASSRLLNDKEKTAKIQTRSGRTICKPNRLDDYLCFSVCLDKNRWECVWNGGDPLFRAAQTDQVSTELHAHLNGSLSSRILNKLINLKPDPVERHHLQQSVYPHLDGQANLSECFKLFSTIHQLTDTPEAISLAASEVIQEFADDGVHYLELRTTPREVPGKMTPEDYVAALVDAVRKSDSGARILLSIDRRMKIPDAHRVVMLAVQYSGDPVIGVELSGDPTDWPSWKQRFSLYRLLSNLNAKEQEYQITALIYLMGERAEEIHSAFNLSADDAKNLDKAIEAFDNHFIGKRNVVYERALFGLRSQRLEETIEEFVTVLHRISEHGKYANLREELIRDRIVLGVKDRKLSEKLMLNENLTLAKAVEIAHQWEAVMREQQDLNPSTSQDMVKTCEKCIENQPLKHEPLIPNDFPERLWQKVGMDLFHYEGNHCKAIFARHGIPDIVISDNGPQFRPSTTSAFTKFASEVGFRHITSSPKHPQSNGQAEAAVKIVKSLMKKNKDPILALMEYRATPLANGLSPAELLFGRKIRTMVPCTSLSLTPKTVDQSKLRGEEEQRKIAQKKAFDRCHAATEKAELIAGEKVWVKDLRAWGSVLEKASAPCSYIVETPVGTYRRNSLLLASSQQQVDPSETSPDSELPAETEETPGNELPAEELQQLPAIAPEIKRSCLPHLGKCRGMGEDTSVGDVRDFIPILKDAKNRHLKISLHLAEVPDSENECTQLIEQLAPDRIGHGTFLHRDCPQACRLVEQQLIPLELCLTSNIISGTVPHYRDHQFTYWYGRGHPIAICTDDKGVFNTSLSQEYLHLHRNMDLGPRELWDLSASSLDSSFTDLGELKKREWSDEKFEECLRTSGLDS
ncbi:hypothetical protein LAZ67_9003635 [Cordylochernes scorpioides]|uniref:Pro-Pol polyprotein n=1 Tax=Cordylochernes scorpioides TaxID=51811 RepID=A0ABY6KV20_9ARAC|nr:hypothetical protein LAZ67_9003635 [Cordylochernes scorpioides]